MSMREFMDDNKKTIIFLGRIVGREKVHFYATGFLVGIQGITHLVTAKHVVVDPKTGKFIDGEMSTFFNLIDGEIGSRSLDWIKNRFKVNWIFHENNDIDIAMIPFGLNYKKDDVRSIPDDLFLNMDRLFELYDVFFLSYQPGIQPKERISPIIRHGTISLINDDKTFYIDASAYPGNSGSPVFLKPSPIRFDEKGISLGTSELDGKFIGIVGESLTYQEVARSEQTGRPRVIFEENTGLSKVWSVTFIKEIMESSSFKEQIKKCIAIEKNLRSKIDE